MSNEENRQLGTVLILKKITDQSIVEKLNIMSPRHNKNRTELEVMTVAENKWATTMTVDELRALAARVNSAHKKSGEAGHWTVLPVSNTGLEYNVVRRDA